MFRTYPRRDVKILFTSWDGTGNVVPEIALARRLASQGHDVRFLGHASLARRIDDAGLRFVPHERLPDLYQRDDFGASADPWWSDVFFSSTSGVDVRVELEREPADVAVIDCLLWGDVAAAESLGVPTIIFVHTLYGRFIANNSGEDLPARASALNAMREHWGLPPVDEPRNAWDAAAGVLVASTSALDLPGPPENVVYVGPLRDDSELRPSLESIANGPLVVVSFSTSRAVTPRLAQRTLDALGDLPVRGLMTTGEHLDPKHPDGAGERRGRDVRPAQPGFATGRSGRDAWRSRDGDGCAPRWCSTPLPAADR
jgi:UDP:flavonoid glycosyltransferase YjiC (YdhE family)